MRSEPRQLYYETVWRASAIALLAAIGFSLIAPAALADAASGLPACCRRKGAHHCAMDSDRAEPGPATSLVATPNRCSLYPGAVTLPACPGVALAGPSTATFPALLCHPCTPIQTESRYRFSFSRCRQKRGPPSPLS